MSLLVVAVTAALLVTLAALIAAVTRRTRTIRAELEAELKPGATPATKLHP